MLSRKSSVATFAPGFSTASHNLSTMFPCTQMIGHIDVNSVSNCSRHHKTWYFTERTSILLAKVLPARHVNVNMAARERWKYIKLTAPVRRLLLLLILRRETRNTQKVRGYFCTGCNVLTSGFPSVNDVPLHQVF